MDISYYFPIGGILIVISAYIFQDTTGLYFIKRLIEENRSPLQRFKRALNNQISDFKNLYQITLDSKSKTRLVLKENCRKKLTKKCSFLLNLPDRLAGIYRVIMFLFSVYLFLAGVVAVLTAVNKGKLGNTVEMIFPLLGYNGNIKERALMTTIVLIILFIFIPLICFLITSLFTKRTHIKLSNCATTQLVIEKLGAQNENELEEHENYNISENVDSLMREMKEIKETIQTLTKDKKQSKKKK